MEEIILESIEWQAPEYNHKKRTPDFLWTIGLIALVVAGVSIWLGSYIFALFVIISGACLIMFTVREPKIVDFSIKTEGLSISRDKHSWKEVKGFNIIKGGGEYYKLMIETTKYFLPTYTIPLPSSLAEKVKENLIKVVPLVEIRESPSTIFAEKIGL